MGLVNLKALLHDLAAPLVDLAIDSIMTAAQPRVSRSDEDLEELKKLAEVTPKIELKETSSPPVPAPIMPQTQKLELRGGIPPGKKRLLDAMKNLGAAEEHLVHKWPEIAREIRSRRKKLESTVLGA